MAGICEVSAAQIGSLLLRLEKAGLQAVDAELLTAGTFLRTPNLNSVIDNDIVRGLTQGEGIRVEHSGAGDTDHAIIQGNFIEVSLSRGIRCQNARGVSVMGKVILNAEPSAVAAIDMFGPDEGIVANNVTRKAGGDDINSWTASATKLRHNNLHL